MHALRPSEEADNVVGHVVAFMFETPIFAHIWIVLPVWLVLYVSDYYPTILGARYVRMGACEHIVFEGSYELTPELQGDVDALRRLSRSSSAP